MTEAELDVAVVGAGAAGLATAIFLKHARPSQRVAVFDSARKPGAKILVSGGARCNVTNTVVTERDFSGGRPAIIRRVLRALPVPDTVAFFANLGVTLHEEEHGKLFPDSNRARDVLDALLNELARCGAALRTGERVTGVDPGEPGFTLTTSAGFCRSRAVVLATGGLSLPKTGSDGGGYVLARRFGHTIVPTSPALVPLTLEQDDPLHAQLSGVSHVAGLDVRAEGKFVAQVVGSLLWTHFGISGPAVLDASRHFLRADGGATVALSFRPGERFESLDDQWLSLARMQPRATLQTAAASFVPSSVASALLDRLVLEPSLALAALTRDTRRRVVHALLEYPLPVSGSRGYNYAEVTAGGVSLTEVDPSTMESRVRRGLYLVGEILDVDGRIGGFNFQWAWSSARAAATALARVPD